MITTKNVKSVKPLYFLPYAGFFNEKAKRDSYIKSHNIKNSISDYVKSLKGFNLLNVKKKNRFVFKGNFLMSTEKLLTEESNQNPEEWIKKNMDTHEISDKIVFDYFNNSLFEADLILYLILTNDKFQLNDDNYKIDFSVCSQSCIKYNKLDLIQEKKVKNKKKRRLFLKVRKDSFNYLMKNRLPWENLSIGFQCQINRFPDNYNSDFWYHFTNVYF